MDRHRPNGQSGFSGSSSDTATARPTPPSIYQLRTPSSVTPNGRAVGINGSSGRSSSPRGLTRIAELPSQKRDHERERDFRPGASSSAVTPTPSIRPRKRKQNDVLIETARPTSAARYTFPTPTSAPNSQSANELDLRTPSDARTRPDPLARSSVNPSRPRPSLLASIPPSSHEIIDMTGDNLDNADDRPKSSNRSIRYTLEWSIRKCALEQRVDGKWIPFELSENLRIFFVTIIGERPEETTICSTYRLKTDGTCEGDMSDLPRRYGPNPCPTGLLRFNSSVRLHGFSQQEPFQCFFNYDLSPGGDAWTRGRGGDREITSTLNYRRDKKSPWRLKAFQAIKILVHPQPRSSLRPTSGPADQLVDDNKDKGEPFRTLEDLPAVPSPATRPIKVPEQEPVSRSVSVSPNPSFRAHHGISQPTDARLPTPAPSEDSTKSHAQAALADLGTLAAEEANHVLATRPSALELNRQPTEPVTSHTLTFPTPEPSSPEEIRQRDVQRLKSYDKTIPLNDPLDFIIDIGTDSEGEASHSPNPPDIPLEEPEDRSAPDQSIPPIDDTHPGHRRTPSPAPAWDQPDPLSLEQSPAPSFSSGQIDSLPSTGTVFSRWTGKASNRINAHSRANLLSAIDKIYAGDPARTAQEDEHRIWLVREEKELTDTTRLFCTVWARFVQEHGTIPFIHQETYLETFFQQYGPILHHAKAKNTVLQHLVRLYRSRLLHEPLYGRRYRPANSDFMVKRDKAARDCWLRLTKRWNELVKRWDQSRPFRMASGSQPSQALASQAQSNDSQSATT